VGENEPPSWFLCFGGVSKRAGILLGCEEGECEGEGEGEVDRGERRGGEGKKSEDEGEETGELGEGEVEGEEGGREARGKVARGKVAEGSLRRDLSEPMGEQG